MSPNPLRKLPSVHELLESPPLKGVVERISRSTVATTVRAVLDEVGQDVRNAAVERTFPSVSDLAERIARRVMESQSSALRPVINATGALLDERFGRAPLAEEALLEMEAVGRDYASLEFDLANGGTLRRDAAVEELLRELTGAEAALVVNNNAAAVMLALAALAGRREVIVSRGQLGEIGDGCTMPELIAAAGAMLREVGATNKTRADDYVAAIGEETAAIMLVSPTDFTMVGAAESVALAELAGIARRHKIPVIHDLDCASLIDLSAFGVEGQPTVADSLKSGADVAIFSGDKLLGGPQCGIIAGRKVLMEKIERHPLGRALRVDKVTLAGLAATLRLYRDPQKAQVCVPLLSLLTTAAENLQNRAERLAPQAAAVATVRDAEAISDTVPLGWGATPSRAIPTWCVALRPANMSVERFSTVLRMGTSPIVGKVEEDRLLLDLRSVFPRQDVEIITALESMAKQGGE